MSASSAALQSAMFANEDGPPPPSIPTSQWAPILPGQAVPPGLWMRMDISTGVRLARLMPKDGERTAEVEGGEGAPGTGGGDPRSPVGVRDDEFDESAPAEDEGATPETFFQTFAPVFERNEKFSKRGQSCRSSWQLRRAGCHGPQAESAARDDIAGFRVPLPLRGSPIVSCTCYFVRCLAVCLAAGPIPKLGDISSSDAEVTAFYGQPSTAAELRPSPAELSPSGASEQRSSHRSNNL